MRPARTYRWTICGTAATASAAMALWRPPRPWRATQRRRECGRLRPGPWRRWAWCLRWRHRSSATCQACSAGSTWRWAPRCTLACSTTRMCRWRRTAAGSSRRVGTSTRRRRRDTSPTPACRGTGGRWRSGTSRCTRRRCRRTTGFGPTPCRHGRHRPRGRRRPPPTRRRVSTWGRRARTTRAWGHSPAPTPPPSPALLPSPPLRSTRSAPAAAEPHPSAPHPPAARCRAAYREAARPSLPCTQGWRPSRRRQSRPPSPARRRRTQACALRPARRKT
mmetsp:Transcript_47299/g.152177  ORF Transcript_47299/g.152177 Transcript_47299/m.152177 type:complete len:277 (-) Transcript_47299:176-1006(-)